jgi:hypothetical protein
MSDATSFNQPMEDWDVNKGEKDVKYMFIGASDFNHPLEGRNVADMAGMFNGALQCNQSLET